MAHPTPEVIDHYFDADDRRDIDGVVALFTDDAEVVDEAQVWRGAERVRAWREGPASKYQYRTTIFETKQLGPDEWLLIGRLEGNFPGASADLTWRFTLAGDRISRLRID
jgi:hypothetical protein